MVFELWLGKNLEPRFNKRKFIWKVTEVEVSCISNGLREPVTEAKEGHLGLRNEKDKGNMPGVGERGERLGYAPGSSAL